jgi:hypothetical protein
MQKLTATMRKGIQRRHRPHFNTRRVRLTVCWTRQQSVKRTAMQSHVHRHRFHRRCLTELGFAAAHRVWVTIAQAHELFPRKD